VFATETGLSLYFASDRGTSRDIYVSRRASINDPWGPPQALPAPINSDASDHCPFVTPDGHRLIFVSTRAGGQGLGDLYVSFRKNELDDMAWEDPQNLSEVNSSSDECCPTAFVHPQTGALVLYFGSTRPGGLGMNDIYTTTLQSNGKFATPTPVSELNSSATDFFPMVRPNGLEMMITSDRAGTLGGLDIWVSTRSTINQPWSTPVNLGPPVNTSAGDARGGTYAGGTRMVLYSNRGGTGAAANDLYEATRTRTTAVPVVGSVTGAFGTTFKTAGQISNPTSATVTGNLVFHPAGREPSSSDPMIAYSLNPFETRTFADLLATFGTTGLGWLEVVPTTGPAPAAMFRVEDGGVVAVPAVGDAQVLVAGTRGVLVTPSDTSRFRFNIGLRTLSNGVTMTISVYEASGTLVHTTSRAFGPNIFVQLPASDLLGAPIAANQTIVFSIDSGSAIVYGSSVANSGGGSTLQIAQRIEP
jgi:hypothetical protein